MGSHAPDEFSRRGDGGAIRVDVDAALRYTDVTIYPSWRERVGFEELGDAITRAAARERALADRSDPGADTVSRTYEDWAGELFTEVGRLDAHQQDEVLFRLAALVRQASDELDRSMARLGELRAAEFTGTDDRRRVTVTLSSIGELNTVDFDHGWLRSTPIDALNTALRSALLRAQDALDSAIAGNEPSMLPHRADQLLTEPGGIRRWLSEEGITHER